MKAIKSAKIQDKAESTACISFCEHTAALLIQPPNLFYTTAPSLVWSRSADEVPEAESFTHLDDSAVRKRDTGAKKIIKRYADERQHAEANLIDIGDTFQVKQPQLNKLSTPYNPTPLVVTERKGTMVTAQRGDGSKITKNVCMFHSISQTLCDTRNCPSMLHWHQQSYWPCGTHSRWQPFACTHLRLCSVFPVHDKDITLYTVVLTSKIKVEILKLLSSTFIM